MKAVEFKSVDILFGNQIKPALKLLDSGANRDQILQETGSVLGAAGVSMDVKAGEICVLMGLSGSGKSTLLRAINGLNRVTRGQVFVAHDKKRIDVTSCSDSVLREVRSKTVSMVFQSFALLPWRSVRDNAGFGLELQGMSDSERNRIVDETLEMVGLSQWSHKFAHELSGGMQQRVGLARALATNPDILLMDEPFSALDPLIREKLQNELLELQRRIKKTIVFVSHDLDEALKIGNRIAIMEGGRIAQWGTAEDILLRPANDYVAEFVKHMNPLNVLRGRSVMTPAAALKREGSQVLLDPAGKIRLHLDPQDRPVSVTVNGKKASLGASEGGAKEPQFITAPVDLLLKSAITLRHTSGHPVVLVDKLGVLAGLCGDEEIYNGILRQSRARK
ncbi:MAG: choline ABC transporter ATP-binding protein [Candidatus Pacebacteria bacterium]|nr:choline ABC transporter ATP-binding protein [Candidatus Paceibacterota bacterium]